MSYLKSVLNAYTYYIASTRTQTLHCWKNSWLMTTSYAVQPWEPRRNGNTVKFTLNYCWYSFGGGETNLNAQGKKFECPRKIKPVFLWYLLFSWSSQLTPEYSKSQSIYILIFYIWVNNSFPFCCMQSQHAQYTAVQKCLYYTQCSNYFGHHCMTIMEGGNKPKYWLENSSSNSLLATWRRGRVVREQIQPILLIVSE